MKLEINEIKFMLLCTVCVQCAHVVYMYTKVFCCLIVMFFVINYGQKSATQDVQCPPRQHHQHPRTQQG